MKDKGDNNDGDTNISYLSLISSSTDDNVEAARDDLFVNIDNVMAVKTLLERLMAKGFEKVIVMGIDGESVGGVYVHNFNKTEIVFELELVKNYLVNGHLNF